MKLPKLTNEQFKSMLTDIVTEINKVQKNMGYSIEFDEDGEACRITPQGEVFYTHYLDVFMGLNNLHDCTLWFEVNEDKPCLRIFNN